MYRQFYMSASFSSPIYSTNIALEKYYYMLFNINKKIWYDESIFFSKTLISQGDSLDEKDERSQMPHYRAKLRLRIYKPFANNVLNVL